MAFKLQLQLSAAITLLMLSNCVLASPDPLVCEGIKCPPMNELICPEDSQLREYIDFSSAEIATNKSEINESLLNECCLARKCACKLCYIPSCRNDGMVIHEIVPETQIPGQCCGSYECGPEPNCTHLRDTEGFWLTDCQRCKCVYGQPICHRTCDEIMPNPTTAYCKSKNLNQFFSHGETWKDGCYECECTNGEEKCVLPFCKALNCPSEKQALLKDHCCPICWPDTESLPSLDDQDSYEGEDTEHHNHEIENPSLAPLAPPIIVPKPITTSSTTTTTTTTTQSPPSPPPCMVSEDPSATYAVYPEVVEVVHNANDHNVFYIVIAVQTVFLVVMGFIIWRMRSQKHSYNTVSNCDDNFNNCQKTSLKIEKIGEII